ncbi:MAG: hypothetical protein ACSHYF_06865 [Verrucomicrobiaceae bacterium]
MQRRKRKKGFWWWSWLLVLFAVGGTGGGWFVGEKLWEQAPKQYRSTAKLRVDILPPFGNATGISGIRNSSESAALRDLESIDFLTVLGRELELGQRWGASEPEVIEMLRDAIKLELSEQKELFITIERDSPEEAQEIVNYMAPLAIERLAYFHSENKKAGLAKVDELLAFYIDAVEDARAEYAAALRAKGVKIDPKPGMDLSAYNEFGEEISEPQVAWQSALDELAEQRKDMSPQLLHWEKKVLPATILAEGELPSRISGPDKEPYQTRGAVAGISLGILFGLLGMFVFWKLFS